MNKLETYFATVCTDLWHQCKKKMFPYNMARSSKFMLFIILYVYCIHVIWYT